MSFSWEGLLRACEVVSIIAGVVTVAALIGQVAAGRVIGDRKDKELGNLKFAVASQQERAAIAEKELLEVKARTAPRRLTEGQRVTLRTELQASPKGRIVILSMTDSPETHRYAMDFEEVLKQVGWDCRMQPILRLSEGQPPTGVILAMENPLAVPDWVNPLAHALKKAGVKMEAQTVPQLVDNAPISLVVGYKPS